jgi:4'-phosphopantetheinyl transferase EntD
MAVTQMSPPGIKHELFSGVSVLWNPIDARDEEQISPKEMDSFIGCSILVRRRSGAARSFALQLLRPFGYGDWTLERRFGVGPRWPAEVVGSMAHCDEFAVAALAKSSSFGGIGVDIEPALSLPEEIVDHVATKIEKRILTKDPLFGRLLFCAKEATYKAVHPKDKSFSRCTIFSSTLQQRWLLLRMEEWSTWLGPLVNQF